METQILSDICEYRKGKVPVSDLTVKNYISTENLIPNKGGLVDATSLPAAETTQAVYTDDVLVSNIRPYFKKIWQAREEGGCSNDVLVFVAKPGTDPTFLYYVLANDKFFDYSTASSKGTKMPRGDKSAIMQYEVPKMVIDDQIKIAQMLRNIDDKIAINEAINRNLEEQAKSLFRNYFIDYEPYGGEFPAGWKELTLEDVSQLSAGGDKPKHVSDTPTNELNVPIYSNGISNEGLYGFTNVAKISEESVTVSARGTIGFVCLRQTPYVPIVRLVSLVPDLKYVSAKYLYHWLESLHISGTGTTQQQLTVPDFKKTKIVIPEKEIMDSFTEIVNPIYDEILKNKIQTIKLVEVRDTLLPKLMSGELDVSYLDI